MNAKKLLVFALLVGAFALTSPIQAQGECTYTVQISPDGTVFLSNFENCSPAEIQAAVNMFSGQGGGGAIDAEAGGGGVDFLTPTPEFAPAVTEGVEIDKLNTYDQSPAGLWTAEVGGEREQMDEMYNTIGQPTVIHLVPALEPNEAAARWQQYGSRWEVTEYGENTEFDLFRNAVRYVLDRHNRGENVSGLIIDFRSGQPVLVANLFNLSDRQVTSLLNTQAQTMAGELDNGWTVDLRVSLDAFGDPVYTDEVSTEEGIGGGAVSSCVATAADAVNLRDNPGTQGTNIVTSLTQNEVVVVDDLVMLGLEPWYHVQSYVVQGEVRNDLWVWGDSISVAADCAWAPAESFPAASFTPTAEVCLGATRRGNADDLTLSPSGETFVVEAWQPVEGFVVVPDGKTITGISGALWIYTSVNCAMSDLAGRGTIYLVTNGQLVEQQ